MRPTWIQFPISIFQNTEDDTLRNLGLEPETPTEIVPFRIRVDRIVGIRPVSPDTEETAVFVDDNAEGLPFCEAQVPFDAFASLLDNLERGRFDDNETSCISLQ